MSAAQKHRKTYTINGRQFTLRARVSPAAINFLRENAEELTRIGALMSPPAKSGDAYDVHSAALALFFADARRTNHLMRTALEGNHEGLDWYVDVPIIDSIQILHEWFVAVSADALALFVGAQSGAASTPHFDTIDQIA